MIVPDANMVLYAYNADASEHDVARKWWQSALTSAETVGMPWQTITAFVRIGTNPRAYPQPLSPSEAVHIVASWLERPMLQLIMPGARHWAIFSQLVIDGQATGALAMDAHLAALTIEHGAVLHTNDADFTRFRGVQLHNPLALD